MKLYIITFNDGKWHSGSLPSFTFPRETGEEAIELARAANPRYKTWDSWHEELIIPGYTITVTKS